MLTLVPIGSFEQKARDLLGNNGFDDLLELLAKRPRVGRLIPGTGGLRKVRMAQPGKGKSGSTRVIYYFHNANKPILLLLIYAKANQENLSNSQKIELKKYVDEIIRQFNYEIVMDTKLFKELESNLQQAVKVAKGESPPQSVYVALSPADIKAIRAETGLSQAAFARSFQLSLETIKGWEQGKRKPDAAAANFLRIIQADPAFVQKALAA